MTPDERQALIERYGEGFEALQIALFHIGTYGLDLAPQGEWTPRQIVHHLADTEVIRSARLRFLLAEGEPHIHTFDEHGLAARLHYERPLDGAMALLKASMDVNIELLDGLTEADWHRSGHREGGEPFTMEDWLRRAANHCFEHVAQLEDYVNVKAGLDSRV